MSGQARRWLAAAAALVALGGLLFALALGASGWDVSRLSTVEYETRDHAVNEAFRSLSIESGRADVLLAPSDDGACRVVCFESEDEIYSVAVEGDALTIRAQRGERPWYKSICSISFNSPHIRVYLPEAQYAALSIHGSSGDVEVPENFSFERISISTDTGDIAAEGVRAGALALSSSTGDVQLSDAECAGEAQLQLSTGAAALSGVRCKRLALRGDTGDLSLRDVIAEEALSIEGSTGDVTLEACDAAEIFIRTDAGDVKGSLLSGKRFTAQSDAGRVDVPPSTDGGTCELCSDTGDIQIAIQ